jgi:hypothetical protein
MKGTLITIGIILLVLGVVGLMGKFSPAWTWIFLILGLVGVIWGAMFKKAM